MQNILFLSVITLWLTACSTDESKTSEAIAPKAPSQDTTVVDQPEVIASGLVLSPFKLSDKNCDLVMPEDMEIEEGWCNSREITGLRVSLNNTSVAQKINGLIAKEITGKVGDLTALKKFVADINTLSNEEGVEDYIQDEYTCSLIDSSNTFMSMKVFSYFYSIGAAHGQSSVQVLNVDLTTGSKITLADLFVNNYRSSLKALAKRNFIAQNGNDGWWFTTGDQPFDLPENFAITCKGITFCYQPYEIGPYAAGAPEVFLSKKDLAKWLKKNPYLIP
jgi:hypothetical protein